MIDGRVLGLIVDMITEVASKILHSLLRFSRCGRGPYFMGVCHHKQRILILLNVRNVVESDEDITVMSPNQVMGEPA